MAGFVDRFKRMWDAPDDEYEYEDDNIQEEDNTVRESGSRSRERRYERNYDRDYNDDYTGTSRRRSHSRSDYDEQSSSRDRGSRNNSSNYVNIRTTTKLQVAIFKPDRFGEETRTIADELVNGNTVVLNLEETNKDMSRRIIDFLSGVTYAKKGKIKKVANSTFLITPSTVDLTGDDLMDELEHSGVYF